MCQGTKGPQKNRKRDDIPAIRSLMWGSSFNVAQPPSAVTLSRWEPALICPRVSHLSPRTLGPLNPLIVDPYDVTVF